MKACYVHWCHVQRYVYSALGEPWGGGVSSLAGLLKGEAGGSKTLRTLMLEHTLVLQPMVRHTEHTLVLPPMVRHTEHTLVLPLRAWHTEHTLVLPLRARHTGGVWHSPGRWCCPSWRRGSGYCPPPSSPGWFRGWRWG